MPIYKLLINIYIKHCKWVWLALCNNYQEFKAPNLHILRQCCMQFKLRLLDSWIQVRESETIQLSVVQTV